MNSTQRLNESILAGILRQEDPLFRHIYFYGTARDTGDILLRILPQYCAQHPDDNVVFLTGEDFHAEVTRVIHNGEVTPERMTSGPSSCDLFVLSGIDALNGKEISQQALYWVLDWFLEHKVPTVITGSKNPGSLLLLEDRIRAQLEGCLICAV